MNILIKLFLILLLMNTSSTIQQSNENQMYILNEEVIDITSATLFEDAYNLLIEMGKSSYDFPSYSDNLSLVYYGKVGLAGTGLNLLQSYRDDSSWVSTDMNDKLLDLAKSIGDHLISKTIVDNSTHAIWSVNNYTSEIDLSYEFGLTGIASFFIELYNQTNEITYANYASKTMQSVFDLVNKNSTDVNFNFDIFIPYFDNTWYPVTNFDLYTNDNASFTGLSYGAAGIAKVALQYMRDMNNANITVAEILLNGSLSWMMKNKIINGTELSFITALEYKDLESTSISSGVSGIGLLFLELYDYNKNSTYLDNAIAIKNWLNGTTSEINRVDYTWIFENDTLYDREFGFEMGTAGVLYFLDRLNSIISDDDLKLLIIDTAINLSEFGDKTNGEIKFAERMVGTTQLGIGSTSWSFGGGGIFKVINELAISYSDKILINIASKIKNYLLHQYKTENGLSAIIDIETYDFESNPMRGLSGSMRFLSSLSSGLLDVKVDQLTFSKTEIGSTKVLSLDLYNIGERDITIIWDKLTNPFSTENNSMDILSKSGKNLVIIYSPLEEKNYQLSLNVTDGINTFSILINAIAFDYPNIDSYVGPENNSRLSETREIKFSITPSDTSPIGQVKMIIRNANATAITSISMTPVNKVYSGVWNTNNYGNGTYMVDFEISDALSYKTIVRYIFEIGYYTPGLDEKIFDQSVIIGLAVGSGFLLLAALILTKKIKS